MNPVSTPIGTETRPWLPIQAHVGPQQTQTQISAEAGDRFEASRDSKDSDLLRWPRQTGMRQASADWLKAADQQHLPEKDPVQITDWLRKYQAEEARQHVILEKMIKTLGIPEKTEPKQSLQIPPWEVPSSVGRAG